MRSKVLTAMGIIVLVGLVLQSVFGIAAGVLVSSVIGIVYGIKKKDKPVRNWSVMALVIDLICIALFCIGLHLSGM